jgi:S-adenosylmethionine:tRNA ribosyltransferase-isomerase
LKERDQSRLLVFDRKTGGIHHRRFRDIVEYLTEGDTLVLNNTRVIPARVFGHKETGGRVEVLFHTRLDGCRWEVLLRPGRRVRSGTTIHFESGVKGVVRGFSKGGSRILEVSANGDFLKWLEEKGTVPLPPYIKRPLDTTSDKERYQTVYAEEPGAVAAPTAGLHFTDRIFGALQDKGIDIVKVTLHVGVGTFLKVRCEDITQHKMHKEYFSIDERTSSAINNTKGRVVACGTTVVRTLETSAALSPNRKVAATSGWTDLFIFPGYRFRVVDVLLTNLHPPRSTPYILVAAFSGLAEIRSVYNEAIRMRYRFASYGDSMLIL